MNSDMVVWKAQRDFLLAENQIIGIFTGAGYGKSKIMCRRAILDHTKQDGWWLKPGASDWRSNHLKIIMGAPHDRYLTTRLIPEFRGTLDTIEAEIGRKLRANTGRLRDGWLPYSTGRTQEMANATEFVFYPLHSVDSAVATDAAALYIDEVTMLTDPEIWVRSTQRVRDPRALKRQIACSGTPEEDHFIYEYLFDPETRKPRPGVTVLTDTSINNPALKLDYFTSAKQAAPAFKDMQIMGRWVAGVGGQRFGGIFDETTHIRRMDLSPKRYPGLQYAIGWDPGFRTGEVLIAYRHPNGFWAFVDEIVIQDMSTYDVCDILLEKGYNDTNIGYLGMDPRDANKRRSSSTTTDEDIVRKKLGVKARLLGNTGNRAKLRNRLDVIAQMLQDKQIVFSEDLRPINATQLGVINAIKHFSTTRSADDRDLFLDKPTRETVQKWKHPIDAMHYIFTKFEAPLYRQIDRENYFRKNVKEEYID